MKNKFIKIFGYKTYNCLKVFVFRFLDNIHYKKKINNMKFIDEISSDKGDLYFGYYDYPSNLGDKVLYNELENNKSIIGYFNINDKKKNVISSTKAFNTQMGSRLRWLNANEIIFNDFENDNFICKKKKIDSGEEEKFSFPIYDISRNLKYSFYPNFTILNAFRPGYGYSNLDKNFNLIKDNGIYRGNFINNSYELILSMQDIVDYNKNDISDKKNNTYINHISCSKYNDLLIFFHLWTDETGLQRNRVFIIDYNGKIINVLDDFVRASHYTFKNEEEILLTVVNDGIIEYRLYNIFSKNFKKLKFLEKDGHPTYINDDLFITDTYPDHNGMQSLLLCDENSVISILAEYYHNPKRFDEYRNDLHPRVNNGILTIDTLIGKHRKQQIFFLDLKKIKKDKIHYKLKLYNEYTKNIEKNWIKLFQYSLVDFSFKAHLTLYKMLHSKNKYKTIYLYNKLQKKYSIWVSPSCEIDSGFHMVHFDGITFGSGVKIGKNCTVYQQVTIGKEKGGFPIIGDNVTIYAGAKVLGGIKIGDNVVIGANAVVLKDVPDNCVAVGIPARIIKKDK